MYIHNYQIHNVLDVYRKQLSQRTGAENDLSTSPSPVTEGMGLSGRRPRQAIIDQVSENIVAQISGEAPRSRFAELLADTYHRPPMGKGEKAEVRFTFTTIDEDDRKRTNSLPLDRISPLFGPIAATAADATGDPSSGESDSTI